MSADVLIKAYPMEPFACSCRSWARCPPLKVPKRKIFETELFILRDPIWVGDLRTEPKKTFV
jgi:hypothetical protein